MTVHAYVIDGTAEFICWDCLREYGPNHIEYSSHPDGGGEADTPQHCNDCDVFLENPLTDYGMQYVMDAIEDYENNGNDLTITEWADFYGLMCDTPGSGRRAQQYQAMVWPNGWLASGRMMYSQARMVKRMSWARFIFNINARHRGYRARIRANKCSSTWDILVSQAKATLRDHGLAEVHRHAQISIENRHACRSCFTCACVQVFDDEINSYYSA